MSAQVTGALKSISGIHSQSCFRDTHVQSPWLSDQRQKGVRAICSLKFHSNLFISAWGGSQMHSYAPTCVDCALKSIPIHNEKKNMNREGLADKSLWLK